MKIDSQWGWFLLVMGLVTMRQSALAACILIYIGIGAVQAGD